ncbi:gluconate 2-dehydrogenase subunit 3 family protein [Chryseolinea sp. T2]|uniref:gluconate 2-dehydrogenase subunit 3 family protein n=1 Tax=Chryseolinea sp. T2 TaxID=3129255 RepID=UPI0030771F42
MNRRTSFKAILATAGGLASLPVWATEWTRLSLPAALGSFSPSEQQMIASIADTIIPKGKDIGALSIGVDKFLIGLLENCYDTDVQENVRKQVAGLNDKAKAATGKDFSLCEQAKREELLLTFATSSDKAEKDFFELMKSETIRGFSTSKEVMLGYLKYKVVPGHYYGCVDATS